MSFSSTCMCSFLWGWGLFLASSAIFSRSFLLRFSMMRPQQRLTLREIQDSISTLGTPCMPNILRAMLSRPALALGTLSMFSLCWLLACCSIESIDENFLGHLGQQKCLAFWWWCRITSFLNDFSQQKQNGFRHVISLCLRPIPLIFYKNTSNSIRMGPCEIVNCLKSTFRPYINEERL